MKKKLSVLLLFCFWQTTLMAQTADSLQKVVAQGQADTSTVITYIFLGKAQIQNQDSAAAAQAFTQGINLAKKLNYARGLANLYNETGFLYELCADYELTEKYYRLALATAKASANLKATSKAYANLSFLYNGTGQYEKAITYVDSSIAVEKQLGRRFELGLCLSNKGLFLHALGKEEDAIKSYVQALQTFDKLPNAEEGKCGALLNIGLSYQMLNRWPQAMQYYEQAYVIARKHNYTSKLAILDLNTSNYYLDIAKNLPLARQRATSALQLARKLGDLTGQTKALNNLGNIADEEKNYNQAITYQQQALGVSQKLQDAAGVAGSYINLGGYYIKSGLLKEGKASLEKGLALSRQNKLGRYEMYACQSLAEVSERLGDYKNAYCYQQQWHKLKDSLQNTEVIARIADTEKKYQAEKKQTQINLLDKQNAIQQLELSRGRLVTFGLVALLLLTLVAGTLLYNRYKLRHEARLKLEIQRQNEVATRALFEGEQNERIRIARDLHDSVGQMLSVVKMNVSSGMDFQNKTLQLVDNTITEVRNISHNLIPEELNFGLFAALESLCNKISAGGAMNAGLQVSPQAEAIKLDTQQALPLYRAVQEVLNNMVKHSKATQITIKALPGNGTLQLHISDNGKGFDTAAIGNTAGLGWKNINARISLLQGTLQVSSIPGKGTHLTIAIPASTPAHA